MAADGALVPLSEPESIEIFRAIFAAVRLHTWRRGDVLLFDNLLFGHARLPGRQPRKLHAIFAAEIDTRTLRRADAPECVHRGAGRACKSAIEITLAQLGLGGYWIILAIVMLFPDRLFRWFGQRIWAVNKNGSRNLGYAS